MVELSCPWCEASLVVETELEVERTCPECLTTWAYEDVAADTPLAA
ncbi:MAG: hypothetical protein M3253_02745 [Chloroflexota bacterium]|nr:hypothetical protein [Chloroflexota bacterium]